jgi:transcriptional regulator with XRE-family HTH domain
MDAPKDNELGEFMRASRARITPEQAGLTLYGDNRRVKGLRREELAMLAGVSASYYTRLEQGQASGASAQVLNSLAAALLLNDEERAHLHTLASHRDGSVRGLAWCAAQSRQTPRCRSSSTRCPTPRR